MSGPRNAASERQVQAANPRASTWLSANAGSGKTRVLTDRVARLLLQGVEPQRILCLTYTKAAASEMQNRLFKRLGEWAMKEDTALQVELSALGIDGDIPAQTLADARRLFARAIETPGGLRIQTIHSFCATLLRRFPLEAGVSPQFTELDDRAAHLLRDEIIEELADRRAPAAVETLARAYRGEDFARLASDIARERAHFSPPLDEAGCRNLFGLPQGLSETSLLADVLRGGEAELLAEAAAILLAGSTNDAKTGAKLASISLTDADPGTLAQLEASLLFGESKVEGKSHTAKLEGLATKATQPRMAHLQDRLNALMLRVEAGRPHRIGLQAARRAAALHGFAQVFLPEYAARKQTRGALDFDDLITRAKALLTDPAVAQWVLFRLDGGIDHILVDEAQDTSPDQWRVVELLAQEFTSGHGAREVERTIFVVGDPKQSIYSFQGADVSAFAGMQHLFANRIQAIGAPFQPLELEYSFRSSPMILGLVDKTFGTHLHADLGGRSKHIAFKDAMPGRVELWPLIEASSDPEDENWFDPVDLISEEHHAARLGTKIAARIKGMIAEGIQIPTDKGTRPCHAGDFLILVRRRNELFSEVIRACKAAGLPIAGADRLKLGGEIAVKDLTALLAFLATPEDDLSLAEVLRSPLFGWTEAGLYRLAHGRPGYLWQALRHHAGAEQTLAVLQDLLGQADFLRPFDLIERALTRHDGRRKLIARLGSEAEDGIDELLNQALSYERGDVPSLTGFLIWLQSEEVEVKRQADSAAGRIRVMTVHGAKGLEAPIVILPDTADRPPNDRDELVRLAGGQVVWRGAATESPAAVAAAQEQRRSLARAESMRLLYVALTRAQCWLIVAAAGKLASRKPAKDDRERQPAWYDLIEEGMKQMGAEARADGTLLLDSGGWAAPCPAKQAVSAPSPTVPDWARRSAPEPAARAMPISPSDLGGAKTLPGEVETEGAMARGTQLHLLLEHLPDAPCPTWPALAAALLPDAADSDALLAEAVRAIEAHSALFAQPALTEVAITAEHDGQRLFGTIDRLILTPERVLAIDYKSNARIPASVTDLPEGLRRQLRAYAGALRQIYPDRQVETAILWTRNGELMAVD